MVNKQPGCPADECSHSYLHSAQNKLHIPPPQSTVDLEQIIPASDKVFDLPPACWQILHRGMQKDCMPAARRCQPFLLCFTTSVTLKKINLCHCSLLIFVVVGLGTSVLFVWQTFTSAPPKPDSLKNQYCLSKRDAEDTFILYCHQL